MLPRSRRIALIESLRSRIREVPGFPHDGVVFYDITTILRDPAAFRNAVDLMVERFREDSIDVVVAMESRGFIFGAPIAYLLGAGFAPIRKLGKLPADKISRQYTLEYASNTLEMHRDAVVPGERILLVDDILATGGTAQASIDMVRELGGVPVALAVLVELPALGGRRRLDPYGVDVVSFITY